MPQATDRSSSGCEKWDLLSTALPEVQFIINEWRACCGKPVRINKTLIDHATTLAGYQLLPGELAQYVQRMMKNDTTGWYAEHGLHLGNVVNEVEKHPPIRALPTEPKPDLATDLEALETEIRREEPLLFTMPYKDDSGHFLVIWHGQGEEDFVLVRDAIDWQYWQEEKALMGKARAYGQSLTRQTTTG